MAYDPEKYLKKAEEIQSGTFNPNKYLQKAEQIQQGKLQQAAPVVPQTFPSVPQTAPTLYTAESLLAGNAEVRERQAEIERLQKQLAAIPAGKAYDAERQLAQYDLSNAQAALTDINNRAANKAASMQEDYAKWYAEDQKNVPYYNSIPQAKDFAANSVDIAKQTGRTTIEGDVASRMGNGMARFAPGQVVSLLRERGATEDEIKTFVYLYNTKGWKEAEAYYQHILPAMNERAAQENYAKAREFANQHEVLATAAAVPQNLGGGVAGALDLTVQNARRALTGRPVDYNTPNLQMANYANEMRGQVAENIQAGVTEGTGSEFAGKAASFLYNTGNSMLDSASVMGLTVAGLPNAAYLLGTSAGVNATQEAHNRGATDGQAFAAGVLAGVAEEFFEEYSIEKFFSLKSPKSVSDLAKNIIKQSIPEASEEVATSLANALSEAIILRDKSSFNDSVRKYMKEENLSEKEARNRALKDFAVSLGLDALGGALSGGVFGAFGGVGQTMNQIRQGANVRREGQTENLKSSARNLTGTESARMAQEISDKPSDLAVGRLAQQVENDSVRAAEIMLKQSNGEALTADEQAFITPFQNQAAPATNQQNTAEQQTAPVTNQQTANQTAQPVTTEAETAQNAPAEVQTENITAEESATPAANQTVERTPAQQEYDNALNSTIRRMAEIEYARNEIADDVTDDVVRQMREANRRVLADETEYNMSAESRNAMNPFLKTLAATGRKIRYEDFSKTMPREKWANIGYFDTKTGEIVLNKSLSVNPRSEYAARQIRKVILHEMGHTLRQTKSYKGMERFIRDSYAGDEAWNNRLQEEVNRRAEQGEYFDLSNEADRAAIEEEVVVDEMAALLKDSRNVARLIKDDRSLAQKIYDGIHDFLQRVGSVKDAKARAELRDLRTAEKLLGQALKEDNAQKKASRSVNQQMLEDQTAKKNATKKAEMRKFSGDTIASMDAEYSELAKNPEKNKAALEKMVEQAAKDAGYGIKAYHGTDAYEDFTVFKRGKKGWLGPGIYLSEDRNIAERYAKQSGYDGRIYESFVNGDNLLEVTGAEPAEEILLAAYGRKSVYENRAKKQGNGTYLITSKDIKALQDKGYDGIVWRYGSSPVEISVFSPEQVKSADAVTYDNNGNPIPLSERFDPNKKDIRWSSDTISSETEYDRLAKNPEKNRDALESMVRQAAEAAIPNSKIRNEDGNLLVVYHGTDANFTVFDRTKGRANMDIQGSFFSPWEEDSEGYGSHVGRYYLDITNPAPEGVAYKALNRFKGKNNAGVKAREYLESLGYDGVNNGDEEYIAFRPEQIKSADPVTYDSDGNVIPLSERFNPENEDIRWSSDTILSDPEVEKIIRDLNKTFGTIPKGESPTNDVSLPLYTKKPMIDERAVNRQARALLRKYGSVATDISERLTELYNDILANEVFADEARDRAAEIARDIVNDIAVKDTTFAEQYKDLMDELRRNPIVVTRDDVAGISDFTSLRRSHIGRAPVRVVEFLNGETSLDRRYQELASEYPELFPDDTNAGEDQLLQIYDAIDQIYDSKNDLVYPFEYDEEGAEALASDVAEEIIDRFHKTKWVKAENNPNPKRKTRRFPRTIAESRHADETARNNIMRDIATGNLSYIPEADKEAVANANERLKEAGSLEKAIGIFDGMIDSDKKLSKKDIVFGERLLVEAANRGDYAKVQELTAKLAVEGTRSGQTVQAFSVLKRMGPQGQLLTLQQNVNKVNRENEQKNAAKRKKNAKQIAEAENQLAEEQKNGNEKAVKELRKKIADLKGEITISDETIEDILSQTTQRGLDEAMERAYAEIGQQVPSTFVDKWNAFRYMAMLTNPTTHIRNIIGNASFIPARTIKNLIKIPMESIALRNSDRTAAILTNSKTDQGYKQIARDSFAESKNYLMSSGKYNPSNAIRDNMRVFPEWFPANVLEAIRKWNGNRLEDEDLVFLRGAYVDAYSQYLKANAYARQDEKRQTQLRNAAAEYAAQEAWKATYRDANAAADAIAKFSRTNTATALLVEGVLPFKKTPLNIARRGLEYSPIGIMTGIYQATAGVRNGSVSAAQAIDRLASGMTGTGIMLLGFLLANMGLLTGSGKDDEKEEAYEKQVAGYQDYSLKLGDATYTLDWLAPTSLPLFTGVELWNQTRDKELTPRDLSVALGNTLSPMAEMSMLSSIDDLIRAAAYAKSPGEKLTSIGAEAVTSYLTQAFPTLGARINRIIDGTARNTYYNDKNSPYPQTWNEIVAVGQSKIPFLSKRLEPKIDVWGREMQDPLRERAVEAFASPGYYSARKTTKVDDEILRLYGETGDIAVIPDTSPDKYVKIDGERKDMTAAQYTAFMRKRGTTQYNLVEQFMRSSYFKGMDDEERASTISKLYGYANYVGRRDVFPAYRNTDYDKAYDACFNAKVTYVDYLRYREGCKNEKGNVTKEDTISYFNTLTLNAAQKAILFTAYNGKNVKNPYD